MTDTADLNALDLRERISYDPETGVFIWKTTRGNRIGGKIAGLAQPTRRGKKYWRIKILDKDYYAHRLAWLYMTGEWPTGVIDHRDNDGLNNR